VAPHTHTHTYTHKVFYTEWAKASKNSDLNSVYQVIKWNSLFWITTLQMCVHTHTFIVFTYIHLHSEQFKCSKTEFTKLARLCDAQYETNAYTRDFFFFWQLLAATSCHFTSCINIVHLADNSKWMWQVVTDDSCHIK